VFLGIDVGADRLHCVAVGRGGKVVQGALFGAQELPGLIELARGAEVVAVDAPAEISTSPHVDDPDPKLSNKFRAGRCAEVALGREYRIWVPWTAPAKRPDSGWMATGFAVYDALASAGCRVIEVYPYAGFRVLAGVALPRKQGVAGALERARLLELAGVAAQHLEMWSHDALDAAVAALVAMHCAEGQARRVGCGHDGSAIWLPAATTD
jgi:predicted nuclease with RNAse H fold